MLPATAGAQARDGWLQATSAGITIVSDAPSGTVAEIAADVERARRVIDAASPAVLPPWQPVVMLAPANERGLRELLPQYWERRGPKPVAAYFAGPHQHHLAVRADLPRPARFQTLLHEYAHLVTHVTRPERPVWLDEGISEIWGAAVVEDDVVLLGAVVAAHVRALRDERRWIPLEQLLTMKRAPANGRERAMFYAQSWVLAHFLMLGDSPVEAGHHVRTAAEVATAVEGYEVGSLEAALKAYVGAGRFATVRLPLRASGQDPPVSAQSIPEVAALVARARFLAEGERSQAAVPLLHRALALDPAYPPALETLGYVHFLGNRPAEALARFEAAIAMGSATYVAYYYRAVLAGLPREGEARNPEKYRGVEADLRRVIDLAPGFAPAYARLADVYAAAGRVDEALPLMRRAAELEPHSASHRAGLAALEGRRAAGVTNP